MRLLFKDGQTLLVQSVTVESGTMHINVINNCYEQLKHLFIDQVTTGKILVEDEKGQIVKNYEGYTVFSYIKENAGGIYIVEMQQEGKDTETRLAELEKENRTLKEENEMFRECLLEMSEVVYQ